nr:class III extradiol ring-cleavage dioxygenase [uncultured Holophaga sp.]
MNPKLPVVFLPHGGGPWPFVDLGLPLEEHGALESYLRSLAGLTREPPRALLMISAHWEEAVPTVMTGEHPPLLFDYYGFPEASYHLEWPAPGDPVLAGRVRELLAAAAFPSAEEPERGFDHGAFVPLKVAFPEARIPTLQLSLIRGLDPERHIALGRALAPLRDEGVLILASGMSFHNLRAFYSGGGQTEAQGFDRWLGETVERPAGEREKVLAAWAVAPGARFSHPREEHLLPLMVAMGAAGGDPVRRAFHGTYLGRPLSAFHFGDQSQGHSA